MAKRRRNLRGTRYTRDPKTHVSVCHITLPGSVRDVRECAKACGSNWFDAGAMRFFNTKLSNTAPAFDDGKGGAYFVSSEKGPDNVRRYSVRKWSASCKVSTIGDFGAYATKKKAEAAARAARDGGLSGRRRR